MSKKSSTFAPAFEKKGRVKRDESVAQQVEHIPFKDGVLGSSPSWFTSSETSLLFFVPLFHTSFLRTSYIGPSYFNLTFKYRFFNFFAKIRYFFRMRKKNILFICLFPVKLVTLRSQLLSIITF